MVGRLKKTERRKIGRLKSYKSRDNKRWSCVRIWHLSQYFWASEKTQGSRKGTYKIQKDWIIKISEQSQGENKKQKDWIRWIQQRRFQGESRYKNGLKTKAEIGGEGGGGKRARALMQIKYLHWRMQHANVHLCVWPRLHRPTEDFG